MDASDIQRLSAWLEQNFGVHVTKQDVLDRIGDSGLPHEIEAAIAELPEGDHSRKSIVTLVQEKVIGEPEMSMGSDTELVGERGFGGREG